MKKILTDCDGVILDWENAFHDWMRERGYNRVKQNTYDLSVAYDLHRENKHDVVSEFNNSSRIGWLEPFRDAKQMIKNLNQQGYVFHVITSLSLDPYSKKLRQHNLNSVFGAECFCELTCLDTGADKHTALEPYRDSGLFWIEDKKENSVLGAEMGLRSILIDHSHNRDLDDKRITRVNNWKQIHDLIIAEE